MNMNMTREEARQYILKNSAGYFEPDNHSKNTGRIAGYVCPICGSGTGRNGTGITTRDGKHFTCWAGCFSNADIFDILKIQFGLTDYNEQLQRACEVFGITIERGNFILSPARADALKKKSAPVDFDAMKELDDIKRVLYEAPKHIHETNYYRGISIETLKKFRVGYIPNWIHPHSKSPYTPPTPRLIIPYSDGAGYLARDTRPNLTDEQKKYKIMTQGEKVLFNPQALEQNKSPVFVVEGEIDALSIIDAGGQAVGLGSVSNAGKLIGAVKKIKTPPPLIIVPDNDGPGEKAAADLAEKLNTLNFFSYRHDLPEKYKDANDFLMNDRAAFSEWIGAGILECEAACKKKIDAEREEFSSEAVSFYLNDFMNELERGREGLAIPTGFFGLDEILDGGLYPGLYVVGAISSLGKTTFCLQITDQIAQAAQGVLVFSLEMSRNELIAKSLSRQSLILDLAEHKTTKHAKTTRGVLRRDFRNETETEIITRAIERYSQLGENLFISEGVGNIGVNEITEHVRRFISVYDKPPVVVIDYLQILSPFSEKATDKQNIDKNVLELKRMSRDFEIPIIGISSFNRENYGEPVSMASFKESGAIEYSSDVLIGLQYKGFDYKEGEKETDRKKRIREILKEANEAAKRGEAVKVQCKILKHRNGRKGNINLDFYPMFNYFKERI